MKVNGLGDSRASARDDDAVGQSGAVEVVVGAITREEEKKPAMVDVETLQSPAYKGPPLVRVEATNRD